VYRYASGELLEADNQWHCEQCGCKVDAVKRACFKKLPHTLCVHLKRFEFDYETMQRLKLKSRFEFPLDLDMTPFTVEVGRCYNMNAVDPDIGFSACFGDSTREPEMRV
jgi:ubiquitin C-terminal hydrolase